MVPVVITGEDARASDGELLPMFSLNLRVKSLPTNIPSPSVTFPTDVGDAISVGVLTLPEGGSRCRSSGGCSSVVACC